MDDQREKVFLINEILLLRQALTEGKGLNPDFLKESDLSDLSYADLQRIKIRLDHLMRTLGGGQG